MKDIPEDYDNILKIINDDLHNTQTTMTTEENSTIFVKETKYYDELDCYNNTETWYC